MNRPIESEYNIQTDRLLLRPWIETDVEPFAAMSADPQVMEYFPTTLTRTQAGALIERIVADFKQHGFGWAACELKATGEFIGFIGLKHVSFEAPFSRCVEIGWRIASQHWRRGYATEGAQATLDFAFQKLGLEEVISMTAVENWKSRRVMEKIGMTRNPQEDFDHPKVADGHPLKRHVLYRIKRRYPVLSEDAAQLP